MCLVTVGSHNVTQPLPIDALRARAERSVLIEAGRRAEAASPLVVVTALEVRGNPPCRPGQKLVVATEGPVAGTLGCSELDSAALHVAQELLQNRTGVPQRRLLSHGEGEVDTYFESFPAPARLFILGANPTAYTLAAWAPELGFVPVMVGEARNATFGSSHQELSSLHSGHLGATDAVIAVDHEAEGLASELAIALRSSAWYVGVVGSRRHVGRHIEVLEEMGLDTSRIETPAGIDIGSRSSAEIALSILAGLVARLSGAR